MSPIKVAIADLYLEYLNDYLTPVRFAEDQGLSRIDALILLDLGRRFHEERALESRNDVS